MSVSLDASQRNSGSDKGKMREPKANVARRPESKADGTRVGTLGDYRGAGNAGVVTGRRNQLRDGS
jgi:hypothetical protein